MKDIGIHIKEQREVKGLSQKELATKIGVKQNTISQYENNIKRPSYEILILIADFFDVSVDYLLGREG